MRSIFKILPWVSVWLACFVVGMIIRVNVPTNFEFELLGYDYGKYTAYYSDLNWISYMPFRHPLLGIFSSPFVLVFDRMANASVLLYHVFLQLTFAVFGALCVWLVKQIAGWGAACIFMTFPFVWIASAVPESYAISMLVLLSVTWWVVNQHKYQMSFRQKCLVWLGFFVLAGGVTLTNALKVAIMYVLSTDLSKKQLKRLFLFVLMICLVVVCFFAIRMWLWNIAHPQSQKTVLKALRITLSWISTDMTIAAWVKSVICNFFLIPLTLGCKAAAPWAAVVYGFACYSVWVMRRTRIVKVLLGMFAVDVVIHIVCGWAVNEAYIFSPHWMWMLPVIISCGLHVICQNDSKSQRGMFFREMWKGCNI